MATYYKVLGQTKNTTSNLALLYHADPTASPTATTVQTIVSTITVSNISSVPQNYSIYVYTASGTVGTPGTFTTVADNAIVYNSFVNANETISLTLGLTLDTHDRIAVNASGASSSQQVNFFAFGSETRQ